ncbi:MAG: methyl-accepting chemotaxis protein, partial [Bdellovibrionales bacterium]|nr:methyl-accepting chemotaxis protein [Bdellovibrionales bacterium]
EINALLQGSIVTVDKIIRESKTKINHIRNVTQEKIKLGSVTAGECQEALSEIFANVEQGIILMNSIQNSTKEQSRSVNEINHAMKNINNLTIMNTKSADYSEGTSHELKEQALGIKEVVVNLVRAVS